MRRWAVLVALLVLVAGVAAACGGGSESADSTTAATASDAEESVSWLFALLAESGAATSSTLTLTGLDDDVILFADAPSRSISRTSVEGFVEQWTNLFAEEKPNALISWDSDSGEAKAVVELSKPTLEGSRLRFPYSDLNQPPERIAALTPLDDRQGLSGSITDVRLFIDSSASPCTVRIDNWTITVSNLAGGTSAEATTCDVLEPGIEAAFSSVDKINAGEEDDLDLGDRYGEIIWKSPVTVTVDGIVYAFRCQGETSGNDREADCLITVERTLSTGGGEAALAPQTPSEVSLQLEYEGN